MSTYAIGDIQGCYDQLCHLLEAINYDSQRDTLWFTGDLVNRGPKSLKTLRFIKSLPNTVVVLGNHDLHLLAVAADFNRLKNKDTIQKIFKVDDCDELLNWLRLQKLIHYDPKLNYVLVHAGFPPQWDLATAIKLAHEVEEIIRSKKCSKFLKHMYGDEPICWDPELTDWARLRFITNCLTRIRYCTQAGEIELKTKGPPGAQDKQYFPWFAIEQRQTQEVDIIFGHWASLQGISYLPRIHAIDTGCIWGGQLTAMRLEDQVRIQVPGLIIEK